MSPDSKTSKAFLLILAFSLTVGTAAAQDGVSTPSIELGEGDEIIWEQSEHRMLNATVKCGDNDVENVALLDEPIQAVAENEFTDSSDDPTEFKVVDYDIFNELNDPNGKYTLQAECEGGENPEPVTFTVDSMDFNLEGVYDGEEWFIGFDNNFKVDFSSRRGNLKEANLTSIEFSIVNGDKDRTKERVSALSETTTLSTVGMDWDGFVDNKSAKVDLKVKAYYNENGDVFKIGEKERTLNLNKWRVTNVNVNPDDSLTASQFTQLNLDADIYYKGDPVNKVDTDDGDFGPENFYLEQSGQDKDGSRWFDGELVNPDKGRYSIALGPTPQELEKKMNVVFDAQVEGNDYTVDVAEIDVENVDKFLWTTKVLTPDQEAVEADFRVNYEDSYVNFTSTNGDFSEKIWPGKHDLEVEFPTSRLSLSEVQLNEGNSGRNILYNYVYYSGIEDIQGADKLDGIKPVNLASYSFAYPFEDGRLEMRFNNEQMDSSESVKVFECTQWHFGDKECKSGEGWEQIDDVTTVPVSWKSTKYSTAMFNIQPHDSTDNGDILQNAYIVGTSADLLLNNGISVTGTDEGRVETGGDVKVSGRIASENDNFVEGAEVDLSLMDGSSEIASFDTVETDSEGRFTVSGEAPTEPGNYTVRLEVEAENYNDLETSFDDRFEVFVAEGVDVDAESPLEVTLGREKSTTVEVVNTGQTEMQDVELTFSGLNSDFYTVSRKDFASIEAGKSRTVEVTFDIPESYGVEDYPELEIEVSARNDEGEEFTDADSIQTQLTYGSGNESGSAESESPDGQEEGSSFSPSDAAEMTGEFLDSQSSLNIALGLILVFMMALAGAVKKKKSQDDDDRRRGGRPAVQKPSVQNGDGKPQNDEEDEDVDSQIDEIADAFDEEGEEADDSGGDIDEVAEGLDEEDESDTGETEEAEAAEDEVDEEAAGEGSESFACEVCGEEFDSESGRDLHRQALHE